LSTFVFGFLGTAHVAEPHSWISPLTIGAPSHSDRLWQDAEHQRQEVSMLSDCAADRCARRTRPARRAIAFLAEGLKPKETGKHTSTGEMSATGVWSERDPHEATAEQGWRATEAFVDGAVRFIERWKTLRPLSRP
jgi:creatinine amidohydrolase/Fe(II)-dependent formamide hydrolase-like protein